MSEQTNDAPSEQAPEAQSAIATPDDAATQPEQVKPPEPAAEPAPKSMTVMDTEASGILDPNVWLQMKSIAQDFFKSGVAPKAYQNPLQILMALQIGKEMGMQPGESLQSLVPINGNFSVWGKAVPGRLRKHGWGLHYEEGGELEEQYCTATITRRNEQFTETVTFREVKASGYVMDNAGRVKPGWTPGLNRRLKLRYDVLDVLIKTYVPEVYGPAAGIAEVLLDVNPVDPVQSTREKINAAENKRKELTSGDFKPAAVESQEALDDQPE